MSTQPNHSSHENHSSYDHHTWRLFVNREHFKAVRVLIVMFFKSCIFSTKKCLLSILKGHVQLMHMHIRYHFLADLHVTRHARETERQKRIRNTQNKP